LRQDRGRRFDAGVHLWFNRRSVKNTAALLFSVVGLIALVAALRGLLRLLGTSAIADAHLRSVTRVEHGTTVVISGVIAYFALRAASRRWGTKSSL
jgi:hypothetical protein